MKKVALPLIFATLALSACSQGGDSPSGGAGYPAKLALDNVSAAVIPVAQAAAVPPVGQWQENGGQAQFGAPGTTPLFRISCTHDRAGRALIAITRHAPTDPGAEALLALIGNGRIARLPVDAVREANGATWRGLIPATDAQLDVLKGGSRIEATVPGGGSLELPASAAPGRVLAACRASDRGSSDREPKTEATVPAPLA